MTYKTAIITYLRENKDICPSWEQNKFVKIKGKSYWFGSSIGRECRNLAPTDTAKDILLKGKVMKHDRKGVLRNYRTFRLNKRKKK